MPARSREAPCRLSAPSLACLFLGIFFIVQQVGHIPQADAQGGPVVQQCRGGGRQYPRHAQCDQRQVEAHDEAVAAVDFSPYGKPGGYLQDLEIYSAECNRRKSGTGKDVLGMFS
mgnify:CR=1 FL=1